MKQKRRKPISYHGNNDEVIADIRARLLYWTGDDSSLVGDSDAALPPVPTKDQQAQLYSDLFKDLG